MRSVPGAVEAGSSPRDLTVRSLETRLLPLPVLTLSYRQNELFRSARIPRQQRRSHGDAIRSQLSRHDRGRFKARLE